MSRTTVTPWVFLLCLLVFGFPSFGQSNQDGQRASAIFLEIGGNAIIYSFNYDSRFSRSHKGLGGRVGVSYLPSFGHGGSSSLLFPVGVNYLAGETHYLELGAGATLELEQDYSSNKNLYIIPSVGYRYQPLRKGFTFRVFTSPIMGADRTSVDANGTRKKRDFLFWGGLSLGMRI